MVDFTKAIDVAKNAVISPKDGLKSLGDESKYGNVVTKELLMFSALIPVALLISWVFIGISGGGLGRIRMDFFMWINTSVLIMFYNIILTFVISLAIWFLKDTVGFTGSKEKANQLAVYFAIAYFMVNSILILLSFISGDLIGILRFLQPALSGGFIFYIIFMGLNDDFGVSVEKKIPFAGVVAGVTVAVGIGINFLAYKILAVSLIIGMFGGKI